MAYDVDCIQSRSISANFITSGQKKNLEVFTKSELARTSIFVFLISVLSYAAKMVSSILSLNSPERSESCVTCFRNALSFTWAGALTIV